MRYVGLWLLAFLAAGTLTLSGGRAGAPDTALAASGCADINGDGIVHVIDITMMSEYFGSTLPPAPPQVDLNKNVTTDVLDFGIAFSAFGTATSCQTDPLPSTTVVDGTLALDADGETPDVADPVETTRVVLVGETFHLAVHLSENPGATAYQVRLHWDEAVLGLNPRTAGENQLAEENGWGGLGAVQVLGPPDDGSGSDAHIELGGAPKPAFPPTGYTGPVAQFEFTCESAGTASLVLDVTDGHTSLAVQPATEYTPTVTGAQVICLAPDADDDLDGCTNAQELGPNERLGGRRDPLYHWDFIDQWTGSPFAKDKIISVADIGASVARFGSSRPGGMPTKQQALAEALIPPTMLTGYHAALDRAGAIPGQNPWNLRPPDGVIAVGDKGAVVGSFGHSCM